MNIYRKKSEDNGYQTWAKINLVHDINHGKMRQIILSSIID